MRVYYAAVPAFLRTAAQGFIVEAAVVVGILCVRLIHWDGWTGVVLIRLFFNIAHKLCVGLFIHQI